MLDPAFQRKSIWTLADRRKLVNSLLSDFPIPSIFLYERSDKGRTVHDVIDGKQRLETLFMFLQVGRFRKDRFSIRHAIDGNTKVFDWSIICREHPDLSAKVEKFRIPIVEVKGDLSDIEQLFVRINSTGKALSSQEKRHAKYLTSSLLRQSDRIARRFRPYFVSERILTTADIDRMKATELVAEIFVSIQAGAPVNKKKALDRAIANEHVNAHTLGKITRATVSAIAFTKKIFPNLRQTRFRKSPEFYSLCVLVSEMEQGGLVLSDSKTNAVADKLLREFSLGVDEVALQNKNLLSPSQNQHLFARYWQTTQSGSDSAPHREQRRDILKGLLWSLYEKKDGNRLFSAEQRRIIWGTEEVRQCPKCQEDLTWSDYSADHITAFAKGGRTSIRNGQPMHKKCNSGKGAR